MKCAKILQEEFLVSEHPEWRGLVLEEGDRFFAAVSWRCDADVPDHEQWCPAHMGSALESDIPRRLKILIYPPPSVVAEFSGFATHEPDRRERNERQVPQGFLRKSTKVVGAQNLDISTLISELKRAGWYIYRARTGRKEKGLAIELSMAQPGYSKPPAALSSEALEFLQAKISWPARVNVYRNVAFDHVEYGDISLQSVEISCVEVGAEAAYKLHFGDGLWPLERLDSEKEDKPAPPVAAPARVATATIEENLAAKAAAEPASQPAEIVPAQEQPTTLQRELAELGKYVAQRIR